MWHRSIIMIVCQRLGNLPKGLTASGGPGGRNHFFSSLDFP
jgi:hypothetical protein